MDVCEAGCQLESIIVSVDEGVEDREELDDGVSVMIGLRDAGFVINGDGVIVGRIEGDWETVENPEDAIIEGVIVCDDEAVGDNLGMLIPDVGDGGIVIDGVVVREIDSDSETAVETVRNIMEDSDGVPDSEEPVDSVDVAVGVRDAVIVSEMADVADWVVVGEVESLSLIHI